MSTLEALEVKKADPRTQSPLAIGIALVVLVAAVLCVFGRTARYSFVNLDDGVYVFENPHVLGGPTPDNIAWAFTTRRGGFWIPFTWITLQMDSLLTPPAPPSTAMGIPSMPSAAVFHISNVVYHGVGTCFLFLMLRRATGQMLPSMIAALLWTVHPLRAESVAWVTERKDVLSGMFGCMALYVYVGWAKAPTAKQYMLVFATSCASLLAKPMTLMLPLLMLLLDAWPLGRLNHGRDLTARVKEKIPLLALAFVDAAATLVLQRVVRPLPISRLDSLVNAVTSYGRYLWMHLCPRNLCAFYPYAPPTGAMLTGAIFTLVVLTIAAFLLRRRQPGVWIGWLWFLIAFLPMIGLMNPGSQAYADRFTYLPGMGLAIAVAFAIPPRWYVRGAPVVIAVAILLAGAAGWGTTRQLTYWHDGVTLFEHANRVCGEDPVIEHGLGDAYLRAHRYDEAIAVFERMAPVADGEFTPPGGIGMAELARGKPVQAIPHLRRALEIKPDNVNTQLALARALTLTGERSGAIGLWEAILAAHPDNQSAAAALAEARRQQNPP